jgi:hypothetical protein
MAKVSKSWTVDRWPPDAGTATHSLTVSGRVDRLTTLTVKREAQTGYLKSKTTYHPTESSSADLVVPRALVFVLQR